MIGDGRFEHREELSPVLRDFPAESIANDKLRRKDIQIRRMCGQPLHAIGPVMAAVHQDLHGASDFGNGSPPARLAGQHFQDGQLEGHLPCLRWAVCVQFPCNGSRSGAHRQQHGVVNLN
ncbi:hypothetical protein XH93_10685 [Bradyrhizobium sp. CCBAU 51753]|nr:hypothetical protein XH93_10685 [Bradyrhizobium sp. CCBAU 51753]